LVSRFMPVFTVCIAPVMSQKVRAGTLIERAFETEWAFFGQGAIPEYGDSQKPPAELPFSTKRANTGA